MPVHNDAVLLVAKNSAGSIIYMIGQYGGWSSVPTTFRRAKRRTPNPNSKTKKQKAFDQAYLEWTMEHFAKYDNCPSVKEYKKWLWEQKNEKVVKVDKDGFIPWNGGEMPVPKGAMVHVKLRSGKEVICTAGYHPSSKQFKRLSDNRLYANDWSHDNEPGDIVAYKVYEDPKVVEEKLNPLTPEITRITGSSCDPYPTIQVKAGDHSTPKIGSTRLMEIHGEVRECRFLGIEGLDEKWWVMLNKAPVKTTYTFWLGVNGEIVDDK
ncbi:hypothetical protein EKK58_08025 [Candidatus Dependentiae bacterium]|nr:MAG: hypothetical protein EKK58_08025 [Candidatus Dependentiae bacterium]